MRIAFVDTLFSLAKENRRIMLLTGDLGFSVFEKYMKQFPNQFLNMGVAEQNMTGVAAGMAMEGKIPIVYSIVPFVTMRNFEQIRNDICYQNLNVKIVGVGAGFSYGPYGHTHHGLEDIGILRTLPNMVILCPGDPQEVIAATKAALAHKGPVYLRLGKAGEQILHEGIPSFTIGKGIVLEEGTDITIIGTSTILYRAWEVTQKLKEKKIATRLISMISIKPLDTDLISDSVDKTKAIFTIEEHSVIGGLGSAVAEFLAKAEKKVLFRSIGVPDRFTKEMGLQEYMRKANGLSTEQIYKSIIDFLKL